MAKPVTPSENEIKFPGNSHDIPARYFKCGNGRRYSLTSINMTVNHRPRGPAKQIVERRAERESQYARVANSDGNKRAVKAAKERSKNGH